MRGARPMRLIRAIGLAAIAFGCAWSQGVQAQVREARTCATQAADLATERIAACARLLESGRLKGKPLGVAYGLRGLAFLDRGDIAHAIADLNRAVELAPDFAPAYQNRGNAWYARGNYGQAIADYDATIRIDPPVRPRLT
jgi:tetratricopeptide (TPR) repeat protein